MENRSQKTLDEYPGITWEKIASITPAGEAECACIRVSHPSKLYALANGILTHNTSGPEENLPPAYIGRDGRIRVLDTTPEAERDLAIAMAMRPADLPLDPPRSLEEIYAPAPPEVRLAATNIAERIARGDGLRLNSQGDSLFDMKTDGQRNADAIDSDPAFEGIPFLSDYKTEDIGWFFPKFQGDKASKSAAVSRGIDDAFRQTTRPDGKKESNIEKVKKIYDLFGGSGAYGLNVALHKATKATELNVFEFDLMRSHRIRHYIERGDKFMEDLAETGLFPLIEEIANEDQSAGAKFKEAHKRLVEDIEDFSHKEITATSGGGIRGRLEKAAESDQRFLQIFKAYEAKISETNGVNIAKAVVQAFIDRGSSDRGRRLEADLVEKIATDAMKMHEMAQKLRDRGVKITVENRNSMQWAADMSSALTNEDLILADPPYYHTSGYAGAGEFQTDKKWNAKGYQAVHDMLEKIESSKASYVYDDEAWFTRDDVRGRNGKLPLPDVAEGMRIFKSLRNILQQINIVPVGMKDKRLETLVVVDKTTPNERHGLHFKSPSWDFPSQQNLGGTAGKGNDSGRKRPSRNSKNARGAQPEVPGTEPQSNRDIPSSGSDSQRGTGPEASASVSTGPVATPDPSAIPQPDGPVASGNLTQAEHESILDYASQQKARANLAPAKEAEKSLGNLEQAIKRIPPTTNATQEKLFSQAAQTYSEISKNADAFQFAWPAPTAKGLQAVAAAYSNGEAKVRTTLWAGEEMFVLDFPDGKAVIVEQLGRNRVAINATDTNTARDKGNAGGLAYQIVGTWAHNTGKTIATTDKLSPINRLRRTSNMISSILRHGGKTDHWEPGEDQGVQWEKGNHEENLQNLLVREAALVFDVLPKEVQETYTDGKDYYTRNKGSTKKVDYSDSIRSLAARFGPSHGIGEATIRRALLTRSIDDGEFRGRVSESLKVPRSNDSTSKLLYSQAPQGNVDAESNQPGYIPTGTAVAFASKTLGRELFRDLVKAHPWWSEDSAMRAMTTEYIAREVVRAAQNGTDPGKAILDHARQEVRRREVTQQRFDSTQGNLRSQSAATPQEIARFQELTADLQANPNLTQANIDAWKQANPEAYAELEGMRESVLKRAAWDESVFHGSDAFRAIFDGGAFFTDSRSDASAYAELRALINAVENNDALSEIVYDVMAEEGAEEITDLGPNAVRDIADANSIEIQDAEGFVFSGFLKTTNPLDLREFGTDVGNVSELWDNLHGKGLLNEAWSDLDEDTQQEVESDYNGLALYRFLEQEGIQSKAFQMGYDAVIFEDISPDGRGTHSSWLTQSANQFKSADPLNLEDGKLVTPDQWADSGSPSILRSQAAPLDFNKLDQLERQAMAEVDGDRTVGDPRLSHSMDNEVWMAYDELRKQEFVKQRDEEWEEAARIMIAKDYKAVKMGILAKGLAGETLSPAQTKAAQIVIEAEMERHASKPISSPEKQQLYLLVDAVRTSRTATARTLSSFRDPKMSPVQRFRKWTADVVYSPDNKTRALMESAPTQASVEADIAKLRERLARVANKAEKQQQAEREQMELRIAQLESTPTKEAILGDFVSKREEAINKRLAEMGLTIEDLLTGPIELRLIGSKIIGQVAGQFTAHETQVIALFQAQHGLTKETIAEMTKMSVAQVLDIYQRFDAALDAELEAKFANPNITIESLELEGSIGALSSRKIGANPGVRDPAEAKAMAKKAKNMMGYFSIEDHEKIQIRRNGQKATRKKKPNPKIVAAEIAGLEWVLYGEGKPLDSLLKEAKKAKGKAWEGAPKGEGKTTDTGKLDLGDKAWDYTASKFDHSDPLQALQAARILQTAQRDHKVWDKLNELFIANLLSAPTTTIVNLTGYAYGIGRYTVGRTFRALVNEWFIKDPAAEQIGELRPMFKALAQHVGLAFQNGYLAWSTELPVTEKLRMDTADTFSYLDEHHGIISGKKGKLIRMPLRALLATDEFAKTLFSYSHAATLAYRAGKAKGLKGEAMERYITAEMRNRDSAIWPAAQAEARHVSFQQSLRSLAEIKAEEKAGHVGHYMEAGMRFLSDLKNMDSASAGWQMVVVQSLLRMTFPFIRTPYRLVEIGMSMTPLGAIFNAAQAAKRIKISGTERQAIEGMESSLKKLKAAARAATGQNKRDLVKRAVALSAKIKEETAKINAKPNKGYLYSKRDTGLVLNSVTGAAVTAFLLAALTNAAEGDDDDDEKILLITGTALGREEKSGMRQLAERTVPEQSIAIRLPNGDRLIFDYRRLDPIATVVATNIDLINAAKRMSKGAGIFDVWARTGSSLMKQLEDKASLRGFSELTDMLMGAPNIDLAQVAVDRASSILVPNLIRNIARNTDPMRRETQFLKDDLLQRTLYSVFPASTFAPAPRVDVYGKDLQRRGGFISRAFLPGVPSIAKSTLPQDKTLRNWNLRHPDAAYAPAAPTVKAARSQLAQYNPTDTQVRAYLRARGQIFTRLLAEEGLMNVRRPTPDQITKFRSIGGKATTEAREMVFGL
jgi:hypothetical protein